MLSQPEPQEYLMTAPAYVRPCHNKYISLTVNAIPNTNSLRQRTGLPFGVIMRPLANTPAGEEAPPLVDFGATGVIRCKVCRAYINPFVQFSDGGARWRCNLCNVQNDVPTTYYSPLDQQGRRQDVESRAELVHGGYDIIAGEEYTVRNRQPMPPCYVFLIDVSAAAIASGQVTAVCQATLDVIDCLPGGRRTMVSFITFDSTVHVYALRRTAAHPQMMVLPDLEDLYLPVPDHLLVNLDECREQVHVFFFFLFFSSLL